MRYLILISTLLCLSCRGCMPGSDMVLAAESVVLAADSSGVVVSLKEHYDSQIFYDTCTAAFCRDGFFMLTHRDGVRVYPVARWAVVHIKKLEE